MPVPQGPINLNVTADDIVQVFYDGLVVLNNSDFAVVSSIELADTPACVLALRGENIAGDQGIVASTTNGIVTDDTWRCSGVEETDWFLSGFNDSHWDAPHIRGSHGFTEINPSAQLIWAQNTSTGFPPVAYCRKEICIGITDL